MLRDRQISGQTGTLTADCVGIASHSVLGVAQFLFPACLIGRGTCVHFQVPHRQEGPPVSVNL